MHGADVLHYGHDFLLRALDGLDESHYDKEAICGVWTVKDVIAHLASHELVFIEILNTVLGNEVPMPNMQAMGTIGPAAFNESEVDKRKSLSYREIWEEYDTAQQKVAELWVQIPEAKQHQAGLLAWYGDEYDLEDFVAYSFYGHKREHSAQINVLKDKLSR